MRELQNSIQESIHKLLCDQIELLGLSHVYTIQQNSIFSTLPTGIGPDGKPKHTEFIFAGIKTDPGKIKSLEGINLCLVEEAEKVSETSWKYLIPTVIRTPGAEIWIVFNSRLETDPTYKRFVLRMPPNARRVTMNFYDNPWFPAGLDEDRKYLLRLINEASDDDERSQLQADYDHIWLGYPQKHANAAIFRRRVVVEDFDEPPERTTIRYGADWGFSVDPTCLIRFWITEDPLVPKLGGIPAQELWISHEAFGYGVELDRLPEMFDRVPGSRRWPIKGDCSQPQTISYVARQGFNLTAAEKWPGSVEDGIEHIKAFRKIHIHTRCKKMQEEAAMYSYKVDRITEEVLPLVLDKWNHGWDAVRYGLDGFIQKRGAASIWVRLGKK